MILGSVIRKWRASSDLSLRDAAKKMNLDVAALQRIEQGKMPSAETLRAILFFLLKDSSPDSGDRR